MTSTIKINPLKINGFNVNPPAFQTEFPLGIILKEAGLISIEVDALENVEENTKLYIKDKLTGETYDITNQAFEINLEAGTEFVIPRLKKEEIVIVLDASIFQNYTVQSQSNSFFVLRGDSISMTLYPIGSQTMNLDNARIFWTVNMENLNVHLKIFDINGTLVKTINKNDSAGTVFWDIKNDSGEKVNSGLYLYQAQGTSGSIQTGKMAIIR